MQRVKPIWMCSGEFSTLTTQDDGLSPLMMRRRLVSIADSGMQGIISIVQGCYKFRVEDRYLEFETPD